MILSLEDKKLIVYIPENELPTITFLKNRPKVLKEIFSTKILLEDLKYVKEKTIYLKEIFSKCGSSATSGKASAICLNVFILTILNNY